MKPKGEIYLDAKNPVDNQVIRTRFLVVDSNIQPILSCRAMMSFGFITVHYENFMSKLVYSICKFKLFLKTYMKVYLYIFLQTSSVIIEVKFCV